MKLPAGWSYDTALPGASPNGERIDFGPVSLTTLVDSPVVSGEYRRTVAIADNGREKLSITADSASAA